MTMRPAGRILQKIHVLVAWILALGFDVDARLFFELLTRGAPFT